MLDPVLGVDIVDGKLNAALLIDDKLKQKIFANNQEGFEAFVGWLRTQGVDRTHVFLDTSGACGDELAVFMHDAGHKVSIVTAGRINGLARGELLRHKNDEVDAGLPSHSGPPCRARLGRLSLPK